MKTLPLELQLPLGLLLAVLSAQQGVLRPWPWQKKHPARLHRESYSYGECGIGARWRCRGVSHEKGMMQCTMSKHKETPKRNKKASAKRMKRDQLQTGPGDSPGDQSFRPARMYLQRTRMARAHSLRCRPRAGPDCLVGWSDKHSPPEQT